MLLSVYFVWSSRVCWGRAKERKVEKEVVAEDQKKKEERDTTVQIKGGMR